MKYSENWLRTWVVPGADSAELAERLTMAGLEVDQAGPLSLDFDGPVVVGCVNSVAPVEGSKKLNLCEVNDGNGNRQVICGAANVHAGLKVALALPGSRIGDIQIAEREVFGVQSSGMICSASELGLEESSEGILELPENAAAGTSLVEYLDLDDFMIEVDLTPNRGDCLSIAGVARELGALFEVAVQAPESQPQAAVADAEIKVSIATEAPCGRYLGRVVQGMDALQPTPVWMAERLRRADVNLVNTPVNITNYVMLELGQPMHAFDLATLSTPVQVRMAQDGEKLAALNGETLELRSDTMLIADQNGPLAVAGVIGGEQSSVTAATTDVLLESAWFDPVAVAGKARSYNLSTDSAHRFERGVDPALTEPAMQRATQLLLEICGGQAGPVCMAEAADRLPVRKPFSLRLARINALLGMDFQSRQVENMLARLGCELESQAEGSWQITAPSWRFDIEREEDLVEEVARIYGYNRLPTSLPVTRGEPDHGSVTRRPLSRLQQQLVDRGYAQAITYSFVDPKLQQLLAPGREPLALRNPISADMSVMRTSLWPGLVQALITNLNRQQSRIRMFEVGQCFIPGAELLQQEQHLGLVLSGARAPLYWQAASEPVSFYDLKGDIEALLASVSADARFEAVEHAALHPGQSAALICDGKPSGLLGRLHPALEDELDLDQPVFLAEIPLSVLTGQAVPRFAAVSRYPEVRRDLALVVDRQLPAGELEACIREHGGETLQQISIFDIYTGESIDPERKSLAFTLTFQHSSHTLSEQEVTAAVDRVLAAVKQQFDATLRA